MASLSIFARKSLVPSRLACLLVAIFLVAAGAFAWHLASTRPHERIFVRAATASEASIYVGDNVHLNVQFSDKKSRDASATVVAPNAPTVSMALLGPDSKTAKATVKLAAANTVVYDINANLSLKYDFGEWKLKESIIVRAPEALSGNSITFALNAPGLNFTKEADGSWQAFKPGEKVATYRMYPPTVQDAKRNPGPITLDIANGRATYTIDQTWLKTAAYPLDIDPTISFSGTTCTWTNGAGTNVWVTSGNWDCGHAPAAGDSVVFDGATSNTAANAAAGVVTDNLYSVTTNANYTGTVTFAAAPINSGTDHHVWNLQTMTVNGGTLVFTGDTTVNPVTGYGCSSTTKCGQGINIVTGGDVTVGSGGKISADGTGFAGGSGPGVGGNGGSGWGGGGGYGGCGGTSANVCGGLGAGAGGSTYGSVVAPVNIGSGGASGLGGGGGKGGGAIQFTVSGILTNNGTISANGGTGVAYGGAGAGGSVYLTAGTFAGSGTITAVGGSPTSQSTSGGGGRIAIFSSTNTFNGSEIAYGLSNGGTSGSAANGTILVKSGSQANGSLLLDNNSVDSGIELTLLPAGSYAFDTVTLNHKGNLAVGNGATLDIRAATGTVGGDGTGTLHHLGTGVLTTDPSLTIGTWQLAEDTSVIGSVTNLTIASGGVLTNTINYTAETFKLNVSLLTLTVNSGGSVNVSGKGFAGGSGPGVGVSQGSGYGGGGGHGGFGGTATGSGGVSYDSTIFPVNIGSGGGSGLNSGGGTGGGAIQLAVSGVLTNNGTIIANGANGANVYGGGGAGGSIYLAAGTLAGNGLITATGGNSPNAYGGGGGRIALVTPASATYTGNMNVYGGTGGRQNGGSGTIYEYINSTKTITIDNNGISNNAGTGITESSLAGYGTLTITNGGMLTHRANTNAETYKLNLIVDNLSVTSTGSINVNGKGYSSAAYTSGSGPGHGGISGCGGGGAGYGGNGGGAGGTTYGSVTDPINIGSGGSGNCSSVNGSGGGAIQLTVPGTLTNNGTISANGNAGSGGSGSGGSVYLIVGNLAGSGSSIAANGGSGGGSGGGGRIALIYTSNTYSGSNTAYGGSGGFGAAGANGTIYIKVSTQTYGSLILDNNGVDSGYVLSLLPAGSYNFSAITLNHKGTLAVGNGATLDIRSASCAIGGDGTGALHHLGTGILTTDKSLILGPTWQLAEDTQSIGSVTSLTIVSGGVLTHTNNASVETYKLNISLTILTINTGGSINVNGKGYAGGNYTSGSGPGGGGASSGCGSGGGGGYGGNGGAAVGGISYGSASMPVNIGSGGGGSCTSNGSGGGAIQLIVSGTLTNNGTIVSNGIGSGNGSGGSGGSVYLIADTLTGNAGSITANGGNGNGSNGGGGGGRIAIYIKSTDTYTGTKTVTAGTGGSPAAGVGTLVYQHFPQLAFSTPADGATGISATPTLSFSATDADSDYYRLKLEVSTDNFLTSCAFTQTATVSSFAKGSCSGGYNNLAGSFAGMDADTNADSALDSYSAGHAASFTFSSALSPSATYNLRASACDPLGACGDISIYSLSATHAVSTTSGVPAINLKGGNIQFKSGTSVLK